MVGTVVGTVVHNCREYKLVHTHDANKIKLNNIHVIPAQKTSGNSDCKIFSIS